VTPSTGVATTNVACAPKRVASPGTTVVVPVALWDNSSCSGRVPMALGRARRIQNNPGRMSAEALNRSSVELQNRRSASLAMSTDGFVPVAPPPYRIRPAFFETTDHSGQSACQPKGRSGRHK